MIWVLGLRDRRLWVLRGETKDKGTKRRGQRLQEEGFGGLRGSQADEMVRAWVELLGFWKERRFGQLG